jgi:cephalosporin hydroxylase
MSSFSFRKLLPAGWRNSLRPWKHRAEEEWQELSFASSSSDRVHKRERLLAMNTLEDVFRFAGEEFNISQNMVEILPFITFVQKAAPQLVGEVGTYASGNSFLFMQAFVQLRKFIAVDLRVKNRNKLHYYARAGQKVDCINGYSSVPETMRRVKKAIGQEQFDFVFIDADHEYLGVRADLLAYAPLVKNGGLIGFHDIVPDHATRYGIPGPYYAGGVHRLWGQLKARFQHWEFVANPDQNGAGIGVIECDQDTPSKLRDIGLLSEQKS